MEDFREDEAWKLAKDLAVWCYRDLKGSDRDDAQSLVNRIRQGSATLAEQTAQDVGSKPSITGRMHLNLAVGALRKLQSDLFIALEIGAISERELSSLTPKMRALEAVLQERKKSAQAERKSRMAQRMSSSFGLDLDDE